MTGAEIVNALINKEQPKDILDLKCRKWYFSLLASSYGAHVEVLDDPDLPEFPDYLKFHPNITYHNTKIEDFEISHTYDFIIVKHVVLFYPKDYILSTLIPKLHQQLRSWWLLFITYHFADSYVMKTHQDYVQYHFDDFRNLKENFIISDFGEYSKDVPYSLEKEHIWYIVLKKR